MAIVQVVVIFLVLGVFGKKIALIAREIDAVTVIDVLRARYHSDFLANMAAIVIVAFFCATMVAQFVGAAKLFEAVTGFSYLKCQVRVFAVSRSKTFIKAADLWNQIVRDLNREGFR